MSITRKCSFCQTVLIAPDNQGGGEVVCKCGLCLSMHPLGIEATTGSGLKAACPGCSLEVLVGVDAAGRPARCLRCGLDFDLPATPPARVSVLDDDFGDDLLGVEPPTGAPATSSNDAAIYLSLKNDALGPKQLPLPPMGIIEPPPSRKVRPPRQRSKVLQTTRQNLQVATLRKRPWKGIALFLVFLAASVGATIAVVKLRFSEPDFLRYLPDGCQFVTVINADAIRASRAYEVIEKLDDFDASDVQAWQRQWGLSPAQVVRLVIAKDLRIPQQTVAIVRTNEPLSAESILALKKAENYAQSFVGGQEVYLGKEEAFFLPDSRTLVFGTLDMLTRVVGRNGIPSLPVGFKETLKQMDISQGAAVVVAADNLAEQKLTLARFDLSPLLSSLPNTVKFVTVQVRWDTNVQMTFTLYGLNTASALQSWLEARPARPATIDAGEFGDFARVFELKNWSMGPESASAALVARPQTFQRALLYQFKPAAYWIKVLQDENAQERQLAYTQLRQLGSDAVGQLDRALRNNALPPRVHVDSASLLAQVDGPDAWSAIPALVLALHAKDDAVQVAAAEALGKFGPKASWARRHLLELVSVDSSTVRQAASRALAKLGEPSIAEIEVLCDVLKNPHPALWQHAVADLGSLGKLAKQEGTLPGCLIERLLEGLGRVDAVKPAAEAALQNIRPFPKDALHVLCHALTKDAKANAFVKAYVADALGTEFAASTEAKSALINAVRIKGDMTVRRAALKALGTMGLGQPDVLETVRETLLEKELGPLGAETLGKLRPVTETAVLMLLEGLKSDDRDLRLHSAMALGEIGKGALLALPMLERQRGDRDPELSKAASGAIEKIGQPSREDAEKLVKIIRARPLGKAQEYAVQALGELGLTSGAAMAPLGEILADKGADGQIRRLAADTLGKLGPTGQSQDATCLAALTEALGDLDATVRVASVKALQNFGPPPKNCVPALRTLLRAEDKETRLPALKVLTKIGAPAGDAGLDIAQTLKDPDDFVRRQAILCLAALGADDKQTILAVASVLSDSEPSVRAEAARLLAKIGMPALPVLLRSLKDKNAAARQLAVSAWAEIGVWDRDSVPTLAAMLVSDESQGVRLAAAQALSADGLTGLKSATKSLMAALTDKANTKDVRCQIARALKKIGPGARDSAKELAGVLWNEDKEVCQEVRAVLRALKLDTKDHVFLLIGAFRNPEPEVQLQLIQEIKELGQDPNKDVSQATLKALTDQLGHDLFPIRFGVVRSLGAIGPVASSTIRALENRYYLRDIEDRRFHGERNLVIHDAIAETVQKIQGIQK